VLYTNYPVMGSSGRISLVKLMMEPIFILVTGAFMATLLRLHPLLGTAAVVGWLPTIFAIMFLVFVFWAVIPCLERVSVAWSAVNAGCPIQTEVDRVL